MSTAFKILYTEDIDYVNKEYMSIMLIQEYGKYSVEVISNKQSHGRIYLDNKDEANTLFNALNIKINKLNSFRKSAEMLSCLKNVNDLNQLLFVVDVFGKKVNQDRIGRLMTSRKFKVKSKIDKNDSMKIKVYFSGDKKAFGTFKGTFLESDFIFEKT